MRRVVALVPTRRHVLEGTREGAEGRAEPRRRGSPGSARQSHLREAVERALRPRPRVRSSSFGSHFGSRFGPSGLGCLCVVLLACDPAGAWEHVGSDAGAPVSDAAAPPEDVVEPPGAEAALALVRFVSPVLIERDVNDDEIRALEDSDGEALAEVLRGWGREPALARSARRLVERALAVSGGVVDGIDYGMPGRLVERVVRDERPWAEVLTSETCVGPNGESVACDSGAPYAAGVLTTRAFLAVRAGRYNLTRAGTITHAFLCADYPLPEALEPRLPRETLLPMFRALTAAEQTDPEAAMSGATNGFHCYSCHGQFGAHAQLFVRFDVDGFWNEAATGLQNPDGMPGESFDGLMASHLVEELAASESAQMLGHEVANLAEAAAVLAEHEEFVRCAAEKILVHALPLEAGSIDRRVTRGVAEGLRGRSPSFQDLVVAALTHPRVVSTVAAQLRGETR